MTPGGPGRDRAAIAATLLAGAKAAHRAGRLAEAEAGYLQCMRARPAGAAEAHHLLGILYAQTGRIDRAIEQIGAAARLAPGNPAVHGDLGSALAVGGRAQDAIAAFRQALRLAPDSVPVLVNLGLALYQTQNPDEAIRCYERAIALDPSAAEPQRSLALAQLDRDDVFAAAAAFRRHAELAGAARKTRGTPTPAKLKHDLEQLDYLVEAGIAAPAAQRLAELFHIEPGDAVAAPALDPGNARDAVERRWTGSPPSIVVLDDFLTPAALDGLQRFCWGSTMWHEVYRNGYLGAFPEGGFACPLLAQIADELRRKYPAIFRRHVLKQSWAFQYDGELAGTEIHADFAAVNINFWITPDDANLDPERGGLVIWDVPAPRDWDFETYNKNEPAIRGFLAQSGARSRRVPYRANRAVIFDSDLFHETDRISFRDGYRNRRINITLLYGLRENGA